MQDAGALQGSVLAWSTGLMAARTLSQLAALLATPPAAPGEDLTGTLFLLDPRHELRSLAAGDGTAPASALHFTDSLAGVAPGYGTLHAPWAGPYQAADHGLLIAAEEGCRQIALLPLPRSGGLAGVYNIGSRGGPVLLSTLGSAWLDHVAAQALASAERLLQRARLLRAGVVDPLTGWNSRHYFLARLREQVAASTRRKEPATCLVIDVDGLGRLNDRRGIAAGDAALLEIGSLIEAQVRTSDSFAHLGEDEFAAMLPATLPQHATLLAERILAGVRAGSVDAARGGGTARASLRVSIGIAGLDPLGPGNGRDTKAVADEWLARAHAALHQAKRAGGDRWLAV